MGDFTSRTSKSYILFTCLFPMVMHFVLILLWNAKLTETQIFRELSIEIESSLFNYRAL